MELLSLLMAAFLFGFAPIQRQPANLVTEIRERDADRRRRLWKEASIGHARQGICLQAPELARWVHSEIRPAVIAQLQSAMDPQRELLQRAGLFN